MSFLLETQTSVFCPVNVQQAEFRSVWTNPDPTFVRWCQECFGGVDNFCQATAMTISRHPTPIERPSLLTAGRSFLTPLPQVFKDDQFGLPHSYADTKGCLLTPQGFVLNRDSFLSSEYEEISYHLRLGWPFGPEELQRCHEGAQNSLRAREAGILAPFPAAVVQLDRVIIDDEPLDYSQLQQHFALDTHGVLGQLIRLWPVTPVRVYDFNQMIAAPIPHPELDYYLQIRFTYESVTLAEEDIIDRLDIARRRWSEVKHQILSGLNLTNSNQYIEWLEKMMLEQLGKMMSAGFSPASGREIHQSCPAHCQSHNWTPAGAAVEWEPTTDLKQQTPGVLINHLNHLCQSAYDALIMMGAVCLDDFADLPGWNEFIENLYLYIPSKDRELYRHFFSLKSRDQLHSFFLRWLIQNAEGILGFKPPERKNSPLSENLWAEFSSVR